MNIWPIFATEPEITFSDIQKLAQAIEKSPYNLTPDILWNAYQRLDESKVKNNPLTIFTDLISIIRYSTGKQDLLVPFSELINEKFEMWLVQQESSGRKFTSEQKEWLVMIKDYIKSEASITTNDLDDAPFYQKGGRIKMYQVFGKHYENLLDEVHTVLVSK